MTDYTEPPVTTKQQMYAALAAGRFGNTVPAFMGLAAWKARAPQWDAPLWGVRAMRSGDRRMRLDVPTDEVEAYCTAAFGSDGFNVSPMVDPWLTWRGEVFDGPTGLVCSGVFGRRELKWREAMKHATETTGARARHLLRSVLNANSYDDLTCLLDAYPGHVVELTALERCYGTAPHRNAIVWEVRCTTGEYEANSGWRL